MIMEKMSPLENFPKSEEDSSEQGREKSKNGYEELLKCGRSISLDFEPRFDDNVDKNNCYSYIGHFKFGEARALLVFDNGKATIIDIFQNPKLEKLLKSQKSSGSLLESIIRIVYKERPEMGMSSIFKEDQDKIFEQTS